MSSPLSGAEPDETDQGIISSLLEIEEELQEIKAKGERARLEMACHAAAPQCEVAVEAVFEKKQDSFLGMAFSIRMHRCTSSSLFLASQFKEVKDAVDATQKEESFLGVTSYLFM
jgi:hypothetical protein